MPRRLRTARWLYGWSILPFVFLILSFPFPPSRGEAVSAVLVATGLVGAVTQALALGRPRGFTRPLALALGTLGTGILVITVLRLAASGHPFGPALVLGMAVLGLNSWGCHVAAMILRLRTGD
ncbi:MAG: hypothetical protein JWM27_3450 [Gemmatimonadetes bacterium]|nr:hypothetical protein [Gemmatimonadota bacterium]